MARRLQGWPSDLAVSREGKAASPEPTPALASARSG